MDRQNGTSQVDEKASILAGADLFTAFSPEELSYLAERSELCDLADGERVFSLGEKADALYILAKGSVDIYGEDSTIIAEYAAGDSFGEMELLTKATRNAHAKADGQARLLRFPASGTSLEEALSGRPQVAALILRSFLLLVSGRIRKSNSLVKENSPWVRELRRQVYGDKLTGLLNKAYLEENLPKALRESLCLLMLKPDNFKDINDRFGHEAGDASLVLLAQRFEELIGEAGTAVRYMGNALAAILPGHDRARALERARELKSGLESIDLLAITKEAGLGFSLSIGLCLYPEHGTDAQSLIKSCAGLPLEGRARGGGLILFPEDLA